MASTTPKLPEIAPAAPAFSYAQAAKGRAASTTAPATQATQTTSGMSTPHKEPVSASDTPAGGSERGVGSVNGSLDAASRHDVPGDLSSVESKTVPSSNPVSSPTSPSFGTASTATLPKDEKDHDLTMVGAGSSESARERNIEGDNTSEKHGEPTEGRRKKGKKQKQAEKEAEKEKEEVKPKVFIPAPLPAVNFWLQRKEDAAKTKPSPVLPQTPQFEAPGSSDAKTPTDTKKRGKNPAAEEVEKNVSAASNIVAKETPTVGKGQKKGADGAGKGKEDQHSKRAGPRGSRASEKEDKPAAHQLPPPVGDAISWPTPETAVEEEKRKAQEKPEKEEKDDAASNKPRTKEKWVPVPYIPTVTFNTPLPQRGGRGRGGVRGGRAEAGGRSGNTNANGDKLSTTTTNSSADTESRAGRDSASRAPSLPPNTKRQPGEAATRDQRKPPVAAPGSKKSGQTKNESSAPVESRQVPGAGQNYPVTESIANSQLPRAEVVKDFASEQIQGNLNEHSRRVDPNLRGPESNQQQSRERTENRSDRGRGGFRGRGGHPSFTNGQHPQHVFANGAPPNGYPVRQSNGPYSPPMQQPPFNNQYAPPPTRSSRGNSSRSQSIPNNMYPRFPNGGPNSQQMPPLQTSAPIFDGYSMQSMSAMPYNPYIDGSSVLAMVTMQLEYYFSIDNLCKDVFLRKHMDDQGFVFLSFIAGFKRIQSLTHEFELLRCACQDSDIIDFVRGDDGLDRLRRMEGWEKWLLPSEEREEAARNPGPAQFYRPQPHRPQQMPSMMPPGQHPMASPLFSPNGTEPSYRPYTNGGPVTPAINGNGNGNSFHPETPLSAAVPDFSPGATLLNGNHDPLESEVTFHDDEVANLNCVFKSSEDSKSKAPFRHYSSRTFSNGSIDGRSIAEEIHDDARTGRTLTNGSRAPETSVDIRRSRSPFSPLSPTKSTASNGPPVMWVKGQGQKQQSMSEENTQELYHSLRARALRNRESSPKHETHADMKLLYEFWSHFLCRNFNLTMYNEFRQFAFEDARNQAHTGLINLIAYYDEVLNSKKRVINDSLARHYVEIVKSEEPGDRPALERLRASWRNGALDLKSRKKIDNLLDSALRGELERAPHAKNSS